MNCIFIAHVSTQDQRASQCLRIRILSFFSDFKNVTFYVFEMTCQEIAKNVFFSDFKNVTFYVFEMTCQEVAKSHQEKFSFQ